MKYLITQEEFEQLIGVQTPPDNVTIPAFSVIYFTAGWCGACRRLDIPALEAALPEVNWLKCDVDQNNYTAGYCGVRSIPAFLIVKDKRVLATLQSSSNDAVTKWIQSHQ